MLLADIKTEFAARKKEQLPSASLVAALVGMEGRPWPEYRKGKPLTQNQLARALKPIGIIPENIRVDADTVLKGYLGICWPGSRMLSRATSLRGFPNRYTATTPMRRALLMVSKPLHRNPM
jgi:hypothetical protein